jgi:1,2-diacylglycerol 3-beta-glucosyltransferase
MRLISILIAARNEEDNILELLYSLEKLNYPKEFLQILIGNDASTDQTEWLIRQFIRDKPYFQLISITENKADLKGKVNVLAQLAHWAKGNYYFFTDADIEVPRFWIENMLQLFDNQPNTGVVTGITFVKYTHWFEACQAIEWLFALKMMENLAVLKIPTTGMGNNMAVLSEAYWAVGGYEKIGFSIVEDYAIYKKIIEKGYAFQQGFSEQIMTLTKAPKNYFEQRKRWVSGGLQSASNLIIPAILQGIALPILLIISVLSWKIGLLIYTLYFLISFWVGFRIFRQLNQKKLLKYLPIYSVYMFVFWFLQFVSYFLPTKLVWKGREY